MGSFAPGAQIFDVTVPVGPSIFGWPGQPATEVTPLSRVATSLTGPVEMWPEEPKSKGVVVFRYDNGTLLELSEAPIKENHDQLGATFIGTKGRMKIIRGDFTVDPPELRRNAPDVIKEGPGENWAHIQNFLDCIKTRKKPNADVEIGHGVGLREADRACPAARP